LSVFVLAIEWHFQFGAPTFHDPLLFVVSSAARFLRSGFMGMGYWSSSGSGSGSGREDVASTLAAMTDPNSEPEFVFLTPK
jgi:hypothetical protein